MRSSLQDIFITGLGLVSWNFNPQNIATQTAPTSQTIYAASLGLRAGQTVTNVVLDVEVASSGTAPTGFFVGIASKAATGVMLAQSSNLASGSFAVGLNNYALTAPWSVTATDLYFVVLLQNGAFSVTNPSFGRGSGRAAVGSTFMSALAGTAQTALPGNGSALPAVYSSASALDYWVGVS
jgi:hypothetical protein